MNIGSKFWMAVALSVFLFAASFPAKAGADASANIIASRTAEVEGIKLHYLTAGQGPAVILLHGYTQTSRMWRPIIPLLAEKFTVIAPDLPGIGGSEIPADGFRTLLERFRCRQSSFDFRSRSRGLYRGLCASRTNARGLGLFCLLSASSQRFCRAFSDQSDHAGPRDRRREGKRRFAGTAN